MVQDYVGPGGIPDLQGVLARQASYGAEMNTAELSKERFALFPSWCLEGYHSTLKRLQEKANSS